MTNALITKEFIDKVSNGRFKDYVWDKSYEVPVDTLDNMIEKYGTPKFIKIDVEGYEYEVLQGLTKKVPSFHSTNPHSSASSLFSLVYKFF